MDFVPLPLDFDDEWAKVEPIIKELLLFLDDGLHALTKKKLFSYQTHMKAYTVVYKLASDSMTEKNQERLYKKHDFTIRWYLKKKMLPLLTKKQGNLLLKEFVERWSIFNILNKWMENFFRYLDNFHVKYGNLPKLREQGLNIFREEVFDKVETSVTAAILRVINLERKGEAIDLDASLVQNSIHVYKAMDSVNLSVYNNQFETPFLEDAATFYAKQSQYWLTSDSTPEYLIKTEKAIDTEVKRVERYMLSVTDPKVRKVCAETLLKTQETTLLTNENSGVQALLRQDQKDDLARLFRMFVQVDEGLPPIALMMREHIVQEGKVILERRETELNQLEGKESPNDAAFIQSLLELHQRYLRLVEDQFQSHRDFQKELKYAFETTVNTDIGKHSNAELLSTYADSVLKSGGEERFTDSQIEDVLEKVVSLFSFLSDKDVFADVYRNHLAKRLLNQRSVSPFAEKSMIQKLKLKCGAHFTSKFEGMLNDFGLGEDLHKKFAFFLESHPAKRTPVEFSCDVLTTGHWPSFRIVNPTMPPVFQKCLDVFEEFYAENTDHRRLTWVHSLGNAVVKGSFKISYDFQVTTLQALAMLVFNDLGSSSQALTFSQIKEKMGNVEVEVMKRVLHSLACQKIHVLNKEPDNKKIEETDTFRINVDFQSKIRKVRIPMASLDDTHNPQRVEEDRG